VTTPTTRTITAVTVASSFADPAVMKRHVELFWVLECEHGQPQNGGGSFGSTWMPKSVQVKELPSA